MSLYFGITCAQDAVVQGKSATKIQAIFRGWRVRVRLVWRVREEFETILNECECSKSFPVLSWNGRNILGYPRLSQSLGGKLWNDSLFGNRQRSQVKDVEINGKKAIDAERGDLSTVVDFDDPTNDRAALTNEGVESMDAVDGSDKNVDGVKEVNASLTCEDYSNNTNTHAISSPKEENAFLACNDNINDTNTHAISSPKCSSCSQNKVALETDSSEKEAHYEEADPLCIQITEPGVDTSRELRIAETLRTHTREEIIMKVEWAREALQARKQYLLQSRLTTAD